MKQRKTFSPHVKKDAVLHILTGESTLLEISQKLGTHPMVITKWKTLFLERAESVFESSKTLSDDKKKIEESEKMIGKLMMQNDFLKKVLDHVN